MMNPHDYGTAIRLLITLGMLWAFAVFLWRRHTVEKFRQDMFALRDSLFDLADANRESEFTFGMPAYEEFRKELNAIIRFAHRISFARAMLFHYARKAFLPQIATYQIVRRRWVIIVGIQDEGLRAELNEKVRAMNWKIVTFMMKTSPSCLLFAGVVIARAFLHVFISGTVLRTVRRQPVSVNSSVAVRGFAQLEVKKRAAHRLRAMHESVWVESREHSDAAAGNLVHC
jgi:hypothetical protein